MNIEQMKIGDFTVSKASYPPVTENPLLPQ